MSAKQKVVILGGGFAGLQLVKRIDKRLYDVILVDKNNYHGFPPLFYQVASSGLDPTSISFPFRRELHKSIRFGSRFHLGEVKAVDLVAKTVCTDSELIEYDKLIFALGTTNNFFNDPVLVEKVFTLKSIDEAIRLRNEALLRCERAAITPDVEDRRMLLNFVVIGGGPAGVEIAGALGELKRYIIPREYPEIDPSEMSITLIEGSDRLLKAMSEKASAKALEGLTDLLVDVRLNRLTKSYENDIVMLDDGSVIKSGIVVWTAGVTAVPFDIKGAPESLRGPGGRLMTDDRCRLKGYDDVYAIGDIGYCPFPGYPKGLPQLAQVAIQQGRYIADGLNRGTFDRPFHYVDKGSMATIGRNKAVADIGRLHLHGWIAWMTWMFIHLISLLGMRSRLNVLLNWVWAYFTYNTALRLLLKGARYPLRGTMWDKD